MTSAPRRFRDEHGLLQREGTLRLDLGCGSAKRDASYVGVDAIDRAGIDVVGDVLDVLASLPDDRVSEIYSSHFLEHLPELEPLVAEVERVLAVGGRFAGIVPHFSNPHYWSDPTHRGQFGLYTLSYFAEDPLLRRRVPTYGRPLRLRLEELELRFRAPAEFPFSSRLKQALGAVVNRHVRWQEFYEENLAWILPCYELRFALRKVR